MKPVEWTMTLSRERTLAPCQGRRLNHGTTLQPATGERRETGNNHAGTQYHFL